MNNEADNTAYFVPAENEEKRGPGVLVLHSWWGLTSQIKMLCEHFSDLGYSAMAPNFFGQTAANVEAAEMLLSEADPNAMSDLVLSSIHALRTYSNDSRKPIAIVGFAMGGSLGLWASTKLPQSINGVVSVYGSQDVDFQDSESKYLLVKAENDDVATEDDMVYTEALIGLGDNEIETITMPDVCHGYMEPIDSAFDGDACNKTIAHIDNFLKNLNK